MQAMKTRDLERERSEQKLTLHEFLSTYNEGLPSAFPRASLPYLREFQKTYPKLFKRDGTWTLDQHRKKFMDWIPQHLRALQR